jgi:hypothetical protein
MPKFMLSILSAALLALPLTAQAADLVAAPPALRTDRSSEKLETALSRYLTLEMIRATFDVVGRDELQHRLELEALRWGKMPPSAQAAADLDRQLLEEASYYLVSLSYLVQVGGAVFPDDKAETVYANDTLVRLEALQRELPDAVANDGEVLAIMLEAERIRSLTEGYTQIPEGFSVFNAHATILAAVKAKLTGGTST